MSPMIQGSTFLLHSGRNSSNNGMINTNKVKNDDYVDMIMSMRFEKRINTEGTKDEKDRFNAFMISLSPTLDFEIVNTRNHNLMFMHGLVIALVGHDSHDKLKRNEQTYFITHRFFFNGMLMERDYLDHLLERKDKSDGCDFNDLNEYVDFRITIDFQNSDKLLFSTKKSSQGADGWKTCFSIKNISKYVTRSNFFINMQQTAGRKYSLKTELYSFKLIEKHHKLDIDENLHVSHDLVEEIFDKVKAFGQIIETDKEETIALQNKLTKLVSKATLLRHFSEDLKSGTKKLQEYMLQSLNKHRMVNPSNMPKMLIIKDKLMRLQAWHMKIYERFVNIKGLLESTHVIKQTYSSFKRVDKLIGEIVQEISTAKFAEMTKRTKKYMHVLKRVDFIGFLNQINNFKDEGPNNIEIYGIPLLYLVAGICVISLLFCCCILRTIKKTEREVIA